MSARPLAGSLAELGPYFAIDVHEPAAPRSEPWLPLASLLRNPAVLTARISQVRDGLAVASGRPDRPVDVRVAASVAHLGLAARLLAPVLGVEALGGELLLDPDQVWWVPELGGPFRLSMPAPAFAPPVQRRPTGACRELLAGPVSELTVAVAGRSVSPRILWGNVASAISGATTMIAAARPDLDSPARAAAAAAMQFPSLAGAADGAPGTPGFRRRSCCLIYRLSTEPAAALCGDCVLASRSGRT